MYTSPSSFNVFGAGGIILIIVMFDVLRHERQAAEAKRLEQLAIKRARIRKLDEEQKREYQERLRSRDNLEREVDKPHAQIDETSELASETMLPKAGFYTTFIIFLLLILVNLSFFPFPL